MGSVTHELHRLSPTQLRTWQRLAIDSAVWSRSWCEIRVTGLLDRARLAQAVSRVVARHESLRTTLRSVPELSMPVQVIAPPTDVVVHDISLAEASCIADDHTEVAETFFVAVATVEPNLEYRITLSVSSVFVDTVSLIRVAAELVDAYGDSFDDNATVTQQVVVAEWLNQLISSDAAADGHAFWRRYPLAGIENQKLPWARSRGDAPFRTHRLEEAVDADVLQQAQGHFSEGGGDLTDMMGAAWSVWLWRVAEIDSIGWSLAGRDYPDLLTTVGSLSRAVPAPPDWRTRDSFRAGLARLRGWSVEARRWQDCFTWDGPGWFPFGFEAIDVPGPWQVGETTFTIEGVHGCVDRTDLRLVCVASEAGWRTQFEWNPERYERATVTRLAAGYQALLRAAVTQPDLPVVALPIVGATEHARVVEMFNATQVDWATTGLLHERVEAQVAATPEAAAVQLGDEVVSYAALNARANQVARVLRARGVGPDVLVGICLERSIDLVVALLATLKAGGGYVPLDAAYPPERLAFMVADAGLQLVVTGVREAALVPTGTPMLVLDATVGADEAATNLPSHGWPDTTAYVIYTSGSTGRPKGVVITHQAIVNHMDWLVRTFALDARDRVLQKTAYSFDASVWEFWAPLLVGGRLVLAPPGAQQDSAALVATMATAGVTVLQGVPSHLRVLGDEPGLEECRTLRHVFAGGEALPHAVVTTWQTRLGVPVHNLYGPTETTIDATSWTCSAADDGGTVPIGQPIANLQAYVLQAGGQIQPVGVLGELCLAGVGVARGYLGRPGLTAERFTPNPWGPPGSRLYRTGDLARWRDDGVLEYGGRADRQVKVRGYRVELGEIEHALAACAGVAEAVVTLRESSPGDARVVAYVVAVPGTLVRGPAIRDRLREQVPEYMVPAAVVVLDQLPRLPNSKVDYAALPAPTAVAYDVERTWGTPRTPTEEVLAGLWAEVLDVPQVGIHDNFFEVGGHSLLATQVMSRVRRLFGIDLPLASLFAAPTVARFAPQVDEQMRVAVGSAQPPLGRADRDRPLPLSFAQQRLWFLEQLAPGNPLNNIPMAVRLRGAVDLGALERSLATVMARHEVLRTSIHVAADGTPVQEIRETLPVPLTYTDLRGARDRASDVRRIIDADARQPFDLGVAPLLRLRLLAVGADEHVLVVTMHHLVSDGWSVGVFIRELTACYAHERDGAPLRLPDLPIQYADYAVWQRSWLHGDVLDRQLAYWRETLADAPEEMNFPRDHPRPQSSSFHQLGVVTFSVPKALTAAVRSTSRTETVTPFMMLLAAYAVLLSRHSGDRQVVVGCPSAGRTRVETEALIGFFINTLPVTVDVAPQSTFRDLLARVRATTLGAFAHQDVPFDRVVEELNPTRESNRLPLFQVVFAFQAAAQEVQMGDLGVDFLDADSGTAKYDLRLGISDRGELMVATLEYDVALFEQGRIERMAEHFIELLRAATSDPSTRIDTLKMLTAHEQQMVLFNSNDTNAPYSSDATLDGLFEAQVARTPDAPAVWCGSNHLTYADVDEKASRIAAELRHHGAGPGSFVCFYAHRNLDIVPALLGILKSGAAYVPLEPDHPAARAASVLTNLGVRHVITEAGLVSKLRELAPQVPSLELLLCVDDASAISTSERPAVAGIPAQRRDTSPIQRARPDDLAYLLFTSGSTGTPKGVMMQHRPVVNVLQWVNAHCDVGPGSQALLVSSLNFDLSVYDIFGMLAAGGSVRVATREDVLDPERLLKILETEPVTFWNSAPAVMHQMVPYFNQSGEATGRTHLRIALLSGDWVPLSLPDAVRTAFPNCRVVALGGATEAAVWSNYFDVGSVDPAWKSIPYGTPISNAAYYILDGAGEPSPLGVAGDLYIGGECLSLGYWDAAAITAQRFVPDPFSAIPGARLYRTGDRATRWPDGTIEFLGRLDNQVKIRGFRVELGEIEMALRRLPGVRDTVVIARADQAGVSRILAYVIADTEEPALRDVDIRRQLGETLPQYMIPTAVVTLAQFPLNANGKLDRAALPEPPPSISSQPTDQAGPDLSPTEEIVRNIWSETLDIPDLDRHDNFFDLGGHSLLATQVMSRIRKTFDIDLPLGTLFEAPTVVGLAGRISERLREQAGASLPPIAAVPRIGTLPLSFAQQRLWFVEQLARETHSATVPTNLYRLEGLLDASALERSINAVIQRHEVLRTRICVDEDGQPYQVIEPELQLSLRQIDLTTIRPDRRDQERLRRCREEIRPRFDLAAGPLIRTLLIRYDERIHFLLLGVHHIVSDGWSEGIFVRELASFYEHYTAHTALHLPDLPVQYADYAVWQRTYLKGEIADRELGYWREALEGASESELPTDVPRPAIPSFRSAPADVVMPRDVADGIRGLGRREGATLFMTMLAIYGVVLRHWTGRTEILVGTDIANRHYLETEGLIGFFVNQLVLRVSVSGTATFGELLARVRQTTLGAYAHQDLPFDMLVADLQPQSSGTVTPFFQSKLVVQDVSVARVNFSGLTITGEPLEIGYAGADLNMQVADTPNELRVHMLFNDDLFSRDTIDRLGSYWITVATAVAEDSTVTIDHLLERLSAADARQQSTRTMRRAERRREMFSAALDSTPTLSPR